MAGGEVSEEEEVEVAALAVESPKSQEMVANPEQVEPDAGTDPAAPEDPAASAEDIAKD